MNTTTTNDLCNEVRVLRDELERMRRDHPEQRCADAFPRLRGLLKAVLDAGRPHSHLCGCDQCNAFEAVRKELRGE